MRNERAAEDLHLVSTLDVGGPDEHEPVPELDLVVADARPDDAVPDGSKVAVA